MKRVLKGEGVFNRPCNRSCQVLNPRRYPRPRRRLGLARQKPKSEETLKKVGFIF